MRRIASFVIALSAIALPGAPEPLRAQGSERPPRRDTRPPIRQPLERGARVRATISPRPDDPAAGHVRLTGRLVRLDADSVLVDTGAHVVAVPRFGMARLEMPDGTVSRRRSALRGAGVGGTFGFIGGAVLGYLQYEPCEGQYFCFSRGDEAIWRARSPAPWASRSAGSRARRGAASAGAAWPLARTRASA